MDKYVWESGDVELISADESTAKESKKELIAEVHKLNEVVGTISLREGVLEIDPDIPLLRNIVVIPLGVPDLINPMLEPERFLCNLHRQYRSAYLWVGEAREVADDLPQ